MTKKTYHIMQWGENPTRFAIEIRESNRRLPLLGFRLPEKKYWYSSSAYFMSQGCAEHFKSYNDARARVAQLICDDHDASIGWRDVTRKDEW